MRVVVVLRPEKFTAELPEYVSVAVATVVEGLILPLSVALPPVVVTARANVLSDLSVVKPPVVTEGVCVRTRISFLAPTTL